MKRFLLVLITATATAISWGVATADDPGRSGGRPVPPKGSVFADEDWAVFSVSANGRELVVQGLGGGCGHDPRASVIETGSAVAIRVLQLVPADLSRMRCAAIARIDMLRVWLAAPIGGRAVVGQSIRRATVGLDRRPTVPRVIGLRVADARVALRAQGFRVAGVRAGVVRGQSPAPGSPVDENQGEITLSPRAS